MASEYAIEQRLVEHSEGSPTGLALGLGSIQEESGKALPAAGGEAPVAARALAERGVVVADPEMQRLYRLLERLARCDLPLLICGEAGAGKTTAARVVHAWSRRAAAPLVMFDCARHAESAIERELFGCERGAFATSSSRKLGLIERAHGGTLVLDQVDELPAAIQIRLLQLLERGRVLRLGGTHERAVDVRIVATTRSDLADAEAAGRFRRDLQDRLSAGSVTLPPLRARAPEIAILAQHFLAAARGQDAGAPGAIGPAALAQLAAHPWAGNVRELEHTMAYAAALADGARIEPWHLPEAVLCRPAPAGPDAPPATEPACVVRPASSFRPIAEELQALERRRMTEALHATGGVQRRAAELIGMPVRTFTFKLTQYGLRDGAPRPAASTGAGRIARRRPRATRSPDRN